MTRNGKWHGLDDVRWKSSFKYTLNPVLRDQYSNGCRRLFAVILDVKDTTLGDLVDEIRHQSFEFFKSPAVDVSVETVRDLLSCLDRMLEHEPLPSMTTQLRTIAMFPVTMLNGRVILQSADAGDFWIPDIPVLYECFQKHAPLLEMSRDRTVVKLANLVTKLELGNRLLTNAVRSQYEIGTEISSEDWELAHRLRSKADYIQGYAVRLASITPC